MGVASSSMAVSGSSGSGGNGIGAGGGGQDGWTSHDGQHHQQGGIIGNHQSYSSGSSQRWSRGSVRVQGADDGATCVHIKIMPLVPGKADRDVKSFKINSAGGVLQGGMAPEVRDIAKDYEKLSGQTLSRLFIDDRRAQQLLIASVGEDYYVVPAPELFSRHTGTCRVLGDKHQRSMDYQLQVGDFLRVGSVGLIVSEMHTGEEGTEAVSITERDLYYLKEDVVELREDLFAQEEAATAAEEGEAAAKNGHGSPGRSPRVVQCYMCFGGEEDETPSNPLVAPCLCKGGTRYVHLQCLQKWQASAGDEKDCVVTSAEVKNTCKVCKSKYKTHVRASDGRLLPLLVHQLPPPYICFLVVTKHETAEELFNTQFQLSFSENKQIVIGRSRNCNMVLDYRTVSTQHATVTYRKGGFFFRDLSSSNGSMLNLRRPMKLPYNQWVRIRYGRSIVAFKAKRSWMRRKLSSMGSTISGGERHNSSGGMSVASNGGGGGGGEGGGGGGGGGDRHRMSSTSQGERGGRPSSQQSTGSGRQGEVGGSGGRDVSAGSQMSLASENGVHSSSPPGPGVTHAHTHTHAQNDAAAQRDHLLLLESLCRVDVTPQQHTYRTAASGADGNNNVGVSGSGSEFFTPGGSRYDSLAHAGESISTSALGAALFQMHLQAASSRRVFDNEQPREDEEEGEEGGGPGPLSGGVVVGGGGGVGEGHVQMHAYAHMGGAGRKSGQEGGGQGVRFVPVDSPIADSNVSQLST